VTTNYRELEQLGERRGDERRGEDRRRDDRYDDRYDRRSDRYDDRYGDRRDDRRDDRRFDRRDDRPASREWERRGDDRRHEWRDDRRGSHDHSRDERGDARGEPYRRVEPTREYHSTYGGGRERERAPNTAPGVPSHRGAPPPSSTRDRDHGGDMQPAKRGRVEEEAHGGGAPLLSAGEGGGATARAETAAEKLAKLRAKQAARVGGAYLSASVGGDYASSSGGSGPPAKGLQRYQQLVRDGRS